MKSLRAGVIKAGFLFFVITGGLFQLHAQYKVSGEIIDVDLSYSDVSLVVVCDGQENQVNISADGKFDTYLQWHKISLLSFKKPGYVAKIIEFSTVLPDEVFPQTIEPYYLPVRLFKMFEGVDTVFFNNPVAKIRFDNRLKDFADDRDYSLNVKYKVDGMRKRAKDLKVSRNVQAASKTKTTVNEANEVVPSKKVKTSSVEHQKKEGVMLIRGLPPLKSHYHKGRTDEQFVLPGRTIHRSVFIMAQRRQVYFMVKHEWGGVYYFIDEADLGCRCISKQAYESALRRLSSK